MKTSTKKTSCGRALTFAATAALFILTVKFSAEVKKGLADAITLCFTVMIPSVFPMLILSSFAAESQCPKILKKIFAVPMKILFGLSPDCLFPLLLGLTGGYPLAAKTATSAKLSGMITDEDAKRLTMFFTSPGLPFAVTVTGLGYFGSRSTGYSLFLSCVAADILCAFIYNIFKRNTYLKKDGATSEFIQTGISERLVTSVNGASRSMLSVCAWIGTFSVAISLIGALFGETAQKVASLFGEITYAVAVSSDKGDIPLTAFCLAFGGVCIFCQLLPDIKQNKSNTAQFIFIRALCGTAASFIQTVIIKNMGIAIPSEARIGGFYLAGNSAAGSAALMFACAVFMTELTSKTPHISDRKNAFFKTRSAIHN